MMQSWCQGGKLIQVGVVDGTPKTVVHLQLQP